MHTKTVANALIDHESVKAKTSWPPVVVGGTTQTAVVLMRDLARKGLRAWCVGKDPSANGFHTAYGKGIISPDPDEQPSQWLAHMLDVAKRLGNRPVLIAAGDHYLSAMVRHADELSEAFRFCYSATPILSLLATKQRQYSAAAEHGMEVPRSQWVETIEDVTLFADGARYPCVIKPLQSRQWDIAPEGHVLRGRKLAFAANEEQLLAAYHSAAQINPAVLVQEVIEGPDTSKIVYLSCYSTKGNRLATCQFRELRTHPMHFGSASVVEPIFDPEADELCDNFLKNLGYTGLCEIELKRDSRDGALRMIEANPRYSGSSDAATYSGIPLGWVHYLDLIGEAVGPAKLNDRHFRHITLARDIPAIGDYVAAGLCSWRDIFLSYRPPVVFFELSLRDWRITSRSLFAMARFIAARMYRAVFKKPNRN